MRIQGTLTALYTPFDRGGEVDLAAFTALAERLVATGSGLVPCGTTGETPTLSDDEYAKVVRRAVEVARGQVPVIAGTGSSSTRDTIAATQVARRLGADGALVVTPPYNKPPQSSLLAHFRAVADQGGLPVLLYNVPSRTGCNLAAATACELGRDPRFLGVKEAAGSMAQIEALVQGAPEGFAVLSGDDSLTLPLLAMGGHGVVSVVGNVAPHTVVRLVEHALRGDFASARAEHYRLAPLVSALFMTTNPIGVKRAAAMLGHAREDVRLPLTSLATDPQGEAIERKIHDGLVRVGLL